MIYKDIPKYPSINKDVAFVVKKEITSEEIKKEIKKSCGKLLNNIKIFDIYEGDKLNSDEKSIAFTLEFLDLTKTLTEEEVMSIFNNMIDDVSKKLNCKVRDK